MSKTTTWAVLADGVFIRIMVNNGTGKGLVPLRTGDFENTSDLTYEMVTGKRRQTSADTDSQEKRGYIDLLADFLSQQCEKKSFDQLIIAAPERVIKELRVALPEQVKKLVVGELTEDLLPKYSSQIEDILGNIMTKGRNNTI